MDLPTFAKDAFQSFLESPGKSTPILVWRESYQRYGMEAVRSALRNAVGSHCGIVSDAEFERLLADAETKLADASKGKT
jgi:hypothetical protein